MIKTHHVMSARQVSSSQLSRKKKFPLVVIQFCVIITLLCLFMANFAVTSMTTKLLNDSTKAEDTKALTVEKNNSNSTQKEELLKTKVLILIGTHLSDDHITMFKNCWPKAMEHSSLLRSADYLFYLNPRNLTRQEPWFLSWGEELLQNLFKDRNNVTFKFGPPERKNNGAMKPYILAGKHGWFSGYDWVIRMNPDVMIQNDSWLVETMENHNHNVSLLFAECSSPENVDIGPNYNIPNEVKAMHSDFTAFKPSAVPNKAFATIYTGHAEAGMAIVMKPLVEKKLHRRIPGVGPWKWNLCRLGNRTKDELQMIHHYEGGAADVCPAKFY